MINYNDLSYAVLDFGYNEFNIGIIKAIVFPAPLAALINKLNFFLSGLQAISNVYY
jgi:hypothetical protein